MRALTRMGIAVDPIGLLKAYYFGKTRKQIYRENRTFWRYLKDNDLLVASKRNNYDGNPIEVYNKQCNGITRGRLPYVNNALYLALRYHNQLQFVPTIKG